MWLMFLKKLERYIEIIVGWFFFVIFIFFWLNLINNLLKKVVIDIDKYKYCILWFLEILILFLILEIFEFFWICIDYGERLLIYDKRNGVFEFFLEKVGVWFFFWMGCFNYEFDI